MAMIHTILDDPVRAATDARDKGDKFGRQHSYPLVGILASLRWHVLAGAYPKIYFGASER